MILRSRSSVDLSQLTDGPAQHRYVYDLVGRLKRVEGSFEETFDFDPAGNLLQQGQASGNRLTLQGDRKYTYDARGNLTEERRGKGGKLVAHYYYNLANQLVKVEKDGRTTEYRYDPLGRRIAKTADDGTSTRFLWAGDQMVQETTGSGAQKTTKTYIYEPESFRPLALIQNGDTYHYHLDHLGTPRELTKDNGDLAWQARYKTYGSVALKPVEEVDNPLRFQGQYFDEETGLHYNRHRYYNPETGQFTTQDPIGLLGGTNSYQYAPNPTGWVDPFGLSCKEPKPYKVDGEYDAINPGPLSDHLAATFSGGKYKAVTLTESLTLFRAGTSGQPLGQFFSKEKPKSVIQTRIDKAVLPVWPGGGRSPIDTIFEIEIPAGTQVYIGEVGSQSGAFVGGTEQIVVVAPWTIEGVQIKNSTQMT